MQKTEKQSDRSGHFADPADPCVYRRPFLQ